MHSWLKFWVPKTILDQPYDCCHGDPAVIPWEGYRRSLSRILFFGCHETRKYKIYCRLSHHQPPTGTCIWVSTAMVVPFRPCAVSSSCYLTVYIISLISYQWDEEFLIQHPPITSLMKPSRRHNKRDPTPLPIFKALPLANVSSCRPHYPLDEKTPPMTPRKRW